jgi:Holliday junction resolvase
MTSQYRRGADFERRVKLALEAGGAVYVVRAAGSHGQADLIAFYPQSPHFPYGAIEFVQAKRSGKMSKADQWALCELALQCGATPMLALQGPRGTPVVFRVLHAKAAA